MPTRLCPRGGLAKLPTAPEWTEVGGRGQGTRWGRYSQELEPLRRAHPAEFRWPGLAACPVHREPSQGLAQFTWTVCRAHL